jgi:succinate dehydrogenase / fumarate reductase, cytochrome b subunit
VEQSNYAPSFGRYEFIIRRVHSLLGLMPIGGYLAFHLLTNASIIDGVDVYQRRADQIHDLGFTTVVILLEWPVIFLPILLHGVIGLLIVCRGKRNVAAYPYVGNVRYTLQRWTGVVAFVFILWHVFHMHGWLKFQWWTNDFVRPWGGGQFDPAHAYSAAKAIQASIWIQAGYAIGVLACVYHFANGLWTMGITWGVWTSPRAQRWASIPCAAIGVFLAVAGLAALVGMMKAKPPAPSTVRTSVVGHVPGCAGDRDSVGTGNLWTRGSC